MEEIKSRSEFGKLFEHHKLTGKGVEVGVKEGWNALQILQDFTGHLYLVDIWENTDDFDHCKELLKDYSDRVTYIRTNSIEASELFRDNDLDFVYIDADHSYQAVKADFKAYYPKVRPGGIISGHDYSLKFPGVKHFVDVLSRTHMVYFTEGDEWKGDLYESWYHFKN